MADVQLIVERLLQSYPAPKLELHFHTPLELLIAVILSAQCTDARVNEVTDSLFRKYGSARAFADADPEELEQEIHSTGFYRNKARNVMACCQRVAEAYGGTVPETLEALLTLPGVGRKTANMVRGNVFGQPAIAVDTHVLRVSQRLGLVHTRDADEAEQELTVQIPEAQLTAFSNALILHGRRICTSRHPRCAECTLCSLCVWEAREPCS